MTRPHVIVFLADQLRRDVLGSYGGSYGCSPKIDKLAAESVVHENHTVNCPLCVPSRVSMITGQYPHVNGAIVNAWDKEEEPYGTCRNMPSLYETLAQGGYRVEHVGTDHLRLDPPLALRSEQISFHAGAGEHRQHLARRGINVDTSVTRSPCVDFAGGVPVMRMYTNPHTIPWPGPLEDYLDVWMTQHMVALADRAGPEQPMALMCNFWLPHCPLSCPEPYFSLYGAPSLKLPPHLGQWCDAHSPMQLINLPGHVAASITPQQWRKAWAVYLGMVHLLDECVGRVIAALKKRGVWDDALVIFSSDHGEMLGVHRMFQKMCVYEDSIRVPFMVKPPGRGATSHLAGARRSQLTQHLDLAATILDYAGLADNFGAGRSMRRIVEDASAEGCRQVFCEFNGNSGRGFQQRAVITPTHKYIHNHGYLPELYDLAADPCETDNLCRLSPPPPQAGELRAQLRDWMLQTHDYIAAPES